MMSATPQTSAETSTGARSGHGSRALRSSSGPAAGLAWTDEDTRDRLGAEREAGDDVDHLDVVDPRPVARAVHDLDARLAAESLRVLVGELRRQVLVLVAPDHEARRLDRAEPGARRLERVRRRRAVELQDRPLCAVVEML